MWDLVELEAPGPCGMRGRFVDHGFGYKCGDKFSHEGNFVVGGAGPGHPPYSGLKKRTFGHPQDHPYQYQPYEDNDYPKYRVDRVKPWNLDKQINMFQMKDNLHHVPKFSNSPKRVTVPRKNYPKATHKNGISREINFKVRQAIKNISDDPKNKNVEVKMMPLDKPLKIHTWNDATHLVFDHLIEHEQFSINRMKMNFNLHHRLGKGEFTVTV